MKKYKIYAQGKDKIVAIKDGFSYPALFIPPIWAFVHKMWLLGLILTLFYIGRYSFFIIYSKSYFFLDEVFSLVTVSISLLFGCKGNEWIEKKLINKEFYLVFQVESINNEQALNQYNWKLYQENSLSNQ
ncbi:MAG: DUF2628 domain-containing protein [Desulfobulbus sp.]|nr:DUF2628 domain-containing protein [Desulfobulbus sp.]